MDAEVSAGQGGSTRRRAAQDGHVGREGDLEVLVVPQDLYDSARAKIEANLRWLLAKAYGVDHVPDDLKDPFYTDQYDQEHIKPPVIHLLLSGEVYCRVCGLILRSEQAASLRSHQSVLQALSARGVQVRDSDDVHVSVLDLSTTPLKMSCHMHLIDSLMTAYTMEMISVEKVVSSVKRFSNFIPSKEHPLDLEDAMVLWINKVITKMNTISEKEMKMKQHLLDSPNHQQVRYRRDHLSGRTFQLFSLVDDLCADVCDGAALLTLIHFYCPEVIQLENICLKDVASVADSVYNIHLLKEFSNEYLNKCFYLTPEDMLYCSPMLRNNVMVFIAELFWWFEVVRPDFVQPKDLKEIRDGLRRICTARMLLRPKTSRSHPAIDVTKRTFPTTSSAAAMLTTPSSPDFSTVPSTSISPRFSVPQRRQRGVEDDAPVRILRSSLARKDEKPQGLSQVWPERRQRPFSQPAPYALHFPTHEDDADNISVARSTSKNNSASAVMTPGHILGGSARPLHQHRPSGQSLLSHIHVEDEEEILEEEELVAVIHPAACPRRPLRGDMELDELEMAYATSSRRVSNPVKMDFLTPDLQAESYYLEPLMPAVPKPAKEKSISLNKEEESGESRCRSEISGVKIATTHIPHKSHPKSPLSECERFQFKPVPVVKSGPTREGSSHTSLTERTPPQGFYLHMSGESECHSHLSSDAEVGQDSDSDIADFEEDDEDVEMIEASGRKGIGLLREFSEVESFKLREDLKLRERDDKEDWSGRCSPCLSTVSCASSCSASGSAGIRMTSFAERKLLKLSLRDGFCSPSSSQKTTPDHSEESIPCSPWQRKSQGSPGWLGIDSTSAARKTVSPPGVPSELLQLHMQLEEQRRAIEQQKKKMETSSARQRLKLGKAAFLNIVKQGEGRSDTLPLPLKHSPSDDLSAAQKAKSACCKDDSCLEVLKVQAEAGGRQIHPDNRFNTSAQDSVSASDGSERSRSIDLLNEAISVIQQQMTQLSLQQDLLMKKNAAPSLESKEPDRKPTPATTESPTSDPRSFAVHFVDLNDSGCTPTRRPPKLSSSQRSKASEPKHKNDGALDAEAATPPKEKTGAVSQDAETARLDRNFRRRTTFRIQNDQGCAREEPEPALSPVKIQSEDPATSDTSITPSRRAEDDEVDISGRESAVGDDSTKAKGLLIQVDLSELKVPEEAASANSTSGEQKNVLGFFFKDDEKAEDEMAKRRAAFMLKQQRKAQEARLRKQQQEADSELKRDEARRKAEEERVRKEEEKARRELIKQEYLRRKQQALLEEQGQVKPRPRFKSRRSRPKSSQRGEFSSPSKGSATPDLSCSFRGSTLSLATEADSVISGEMETQRAESVCSMDSFPVLSRTSSRNMERDWESGSVASSIMSTEYNGPKLFKEPSSKSNKPIIINAIAHCCLAGKVNEAQKNVLLEELEKCESNHLIILFRDGGCQFRAVYSYSPETEDIVKFTGTGPRAIGHKMIDRLYKYSSDRKQFNVIPAKSVSVSVDALTIHNHLWQAKRPGSARRK
ncbi:calmodulin-regulated spectrin-associated protein 1-B-like isoform X2 [Hippocampus zosterae]|uniref:calmodulin-regulated spectrin-associated protein 1-B-like isoform X2 n=1 Tax=Hippocampus zosterae TaxID=109293 RepID=UPI00223E46B6|nr:calmodulin-regulated spectrin-associated protein 1-B-like isoform X2 [Hippocampus zosterae]